MFCVIDTSQDVTLDIFQLIGISGLKVSKTGIKVSGTTNLKAKCFTLPYEAQISRERWCQSVIPAFDQ